MKNLDRIINAGTARTLRDLAWAVERGDFPFIEIKQDALGLRLTVMKEEPSSEEVYVAPGADITTLLSQYSTSNKVPSDFNTFTTTQKFDFLGEVFKRYPNTRVRDLALTLATPLGELGSLLDEHNDSHTRDELIEGLKKAHIEKIKSRKLPSEFLNDPAVLKSLIAYLLDIAPTLTPSEVCKITGVSMKEMLDLQALLLTGVIENEKGS